MSAATRRTPTSDAVIDIANTGKTIPAESLPRLFDRFFRADSSRTGEGAHSGLHLAIARSIVEAHGSAVSVVSSEGKTRFSLRSPLLQRSP